MHMCSESSRSGLSTLPSACSAAITPSLTIVSIGEDMVLMRAHLQGMPTNVDERNAHVFWKAKKWALHIAARLVSRQLIITLSSA